MSIFSFKLFTRNSKFKKEKKREGTVNQTVDGTEAGKERDKMSNSKLSRDEDKAQLAVFPR